MTISYHVLGTVPLQGYWRQRCGWNCSLCDTHTCTVEAQETLVGYIKRSLTTPHQGLRLSLFPEVSLGDAWATTPQIHLCLGILQSSPTPCPKLDLPFCPPKPGLLSCFPLTKPSPQPTSCPQLRPAHWTCPTLLFCHPVLMVSLLDGSPLKVFAPLKVLSLDHCQGPSVVFRLICPPEPKLGTHQLPVPLPWMLHPRHLLPLCPKLGDGANLTTNLAQSPLSDRLALSAL